MKTSKTSPILGGYPPALTAAQTAEILQLPVKTVYDLGAKGKLPRIKLGQTVRFPREGIMELLEVKSCAK